MCIFIKKPIFLFVIKKVNRRVKLILLQDFLTKNLGLQDKLFNVNT